MYEMMIPPFKIVDFSEMNNKQAKEYFDWYISQIEKRIALLISSINEEGNIDCLDYTIESLIPLWEWYERRIKYRIIDQEEREARIKKLPYWMHEYVSDNDLSWETLTYGMDVAIYFAEVIVRHNEKIKWGFFTKPKNRADVNQPVLLGFNNDIDLNPRLIVQNCTRRSAKEKQSTRLYDMYYTWMKYI